MRKVLPSKLSIILAAGASLFAAAGAAAGQPAATKPAAAQKTQPDVKKSPAQAQPAAAKPKPKEDQPFYRLRVSKDVPATISLKSKDAQLTEVAAELERKLKVPVVLSSLMQKQKLTAEFANLPLEGAARLLAPQVYIDYEVSGDAGTQPKPIGIFLHGMNEPTPDVTAVVQGDSEAILIEGNTEDGVEDAGGSKSKEEEQPLRVKFERSQLSIRARKQPLTAVLYEIASKVDIPFEMKYESSELVDVDFNNYSIDQVVRSLSPNIRLYMRTNLLTYEVTPLRLVLVPPVSSQQTIKM
ncbi:MAG: hypothetical protein LC747_02140 [Acidobacteria bacterium]|nr:hypothetical protein [Acidobacteriota bacterium]